MKILQFIGKGQVTIPQEWRNILNMEGNAVKASLKGNQIILEPLVLEKNSWDTELISLNELPESDKKLVKEGRKAYKAGKTDKFMNSAEFFEI
jgi:bifunctional DNA-binding transcriptional regulator/antitoxin component of YhaV-PrlF toxin-antitoxin module